MSRRTLLLCKEKLRPVGSKNGVLMALWAGIQELVNSPIIFPSDSMDEETRKK